MLSSPVKILPSIVVFYRCLALKTMPIVTVTWSRILVVSWVTINKRNRGKENALQFLDSIAYVRLEHDYNVSMYELQKYNDVLATWVEENAPDHWAMSKLSKQRWDKMTTKLVESLNVWLRNEKHHSICNFLI